jgi:PEP-CTERM motif-containing protein
MPKLAIVSLFAIVCVMVFFPIRAGATPVTLFSTGSPDGLIATKSGPAVGTALETETADDFVLGQNAIVSGATFVGLLPLGTALGSITGVEIELYHVFPADSADPPDGKVLTRVNSPSDNEFAAFDSADGSLTFSAAVLNSMFSALNSVVNNINPIPQFTGGEGAVTGEEVQFNITFTSPFFVGATDHDFFRPEVSLSVPGNFLWLSAPKPITAPGSPFQFPGGPTTDLQTWIRNDGAGGIAPDWSRVGTDITHQGPFNAAFSLTGDAAVPEPTSLLLLGSGLIGAGVRRYKRRRQ